MSGNTLSIPGCFLSMLVELGSKPSESTQIWPLPGQLGRDCPKLSRIWGHLARTQLNSTGFGGQIPP